jgi:hypothetical protein
MDNSYVTTVGFYDSPVMLGATRIKIRKEKCTMPIKDLTDIDRPPRQGMLRLGVKKKAKNGREYPSEVSFFILDPETPDETERQRLIDLFHKTFGKEPKVLDIMLENPENKEQFPQSYKRYGKNTGLKCIGDGETATCTEQQYTAGLKAAGKDKRDFPIVECEGRKCAFAVTNDASKSKECKATGTLSVTIGALGGLGVWQVTTGSFNSIVNINSGIRELIKKYGRAFALPLKLERRQQETTHKGQSATHYPLHLNTNGDIQKYFEESRVSRVEGDIPAVDDEIADADMAEDERDMTTGQALKEIAERDLSPEQKKKCDEMLDGAVKEVKGEMTFEEADAHVKTVIEDAVLGPKVEHDKAVLEHLKDVEKQKVVDTVNLVKDTFGAKDEDVVIEDKPLDMPGAAVAEQVRANRIAKLLPKNFYEFMGFARGKLQAAGKLDDYKKVLSGLGVTSPTQLKEEDKIDLARIDIEELLEEVL